MSLSQLIANISQYIIQPIIEILVGVGLLVFVWGLVEFIAGVNGLAKSDKKEDGKRHMLWGIIGMFVMVSAVAILRFIASSVGAPVNF